MTGWAYVDVKGPIVNTYLAKMFMPKEVTVTKVKKSGPVYDLAGTPIAYEYLVYYEYDKKDEKIIKEWSERNDRKRRQNH